MTAETLTRTNNESWVDWLLPGQETGVLITREELAAEVSQRPVKPVTVNDLRFWEAHGVIPRALRKRHDGATRAVYPKWMIGAVVLLRIMQDSGLSLETITEAIRYDYRKNLDNPHFGSTATTGFENKRSVTQLAPHQNGIIPLLAHDDIVDFINANGFDGLGYVDLKLVAKDGTTARFRRYIPGFPNQSHDEDPGSTGSN